jgi:hypothetical protein
MIAEKGQLVREPRIVRRDQARVAEGPQVLAREE